MKEKNYNLRIFLVSMGIPLLSAVLFRPRLVTANQGLLEYQAGFPIGFWTFGTLKELPESRWQGIVLKGSASVQFDVLLYFVNVCLVFVILYYTTYRVLDTRAKVKDA